MGFLSKRKSKGFTLFELLLVVTILGLIAIFILIIAPTQISKARDARRKVDLEKIKVSLYDYYFDKECFPQELPACDQSLKLGDVIYLEKFPCDLKNDNYVYQIEESECPQWFKILTNLENNQDASIIKVGCQDGCGPECQYNYGLASSNIHLYDQCRINIYYACSPGGRCIEYENPTISDCPQVFNNDSSCQNICSDKDNRCDNEKGKRVPGD